MFGPLEPSVLLLLLGVVWSSKEGNRLLPSSVPTPPRLSLAFVRNLLSNLQTRKVIHASMMHEPKTRASKRCTLLLNAPLSPFGRLTQRQRRTTWI